MRQKTHARKLRQETKTATVVSLPQPMMKTLSTIPYSPSKLFPCPQRPCLQHSTIDRVRTVRCEGGQTTVPLEPRKTALKKGRNTTKKMESLREGLVFFYSPFFFPRRYNFQLDFSILFLLSSSFFGQRASLFTINHDACGHAPAASRDASRITLVGTSKSRCYNCSSSGGVSKMSTFKHNQSPSRLSFPRQRQLSLFFSIRL